MAPVSSSITRTLASGDIVVSLADIVERLGGKLSQAEIDDLMRAILSKRKSEVRPGDLITSDLMNQVLAELADLQVRVAAIEGQTPGSNGQLILVRPENGDQFRIGDDMVLEGKNLGFSEGTSFVTLDGVRATEYRPGSSDGKITLKVPSIQVNTEDGREVVLLVANAISSASRVVRVRPSQALTGAVSIAWMSVSPSTMRSGSPVTFDFTLKSGTNLDAQFLISPTISRVANAAAWNGDNLVVLENGVERPDRRILLRSGASVPIQVRINTVPQVPADTTFSLSVLAASGVVRGSTGRLRLSVGPTIQLPDADTTMAISDISFHVPADGTWVRGTETDLLRLVKSKTAMATMTVRVHKPGAYVARAAPLASPEFPTTQWTFVRHPQDPVDPTDPNTTLFTVTQAQIDQAGAEGVPVAPRFMITAEQGASTAGEVEFKVERNRSGVSRTIGLELAAV